MTANCPRVALDCYVRAEAAGVFVDDIINTIHSYEEEGLVEECAVEFWPNEIRLMDDTERTDVLAHYRQFQAWADGEDVSLKPAFTRRERTTMGSDDSETVLVLPVSCLAIRADRELVHVAPHTTESMPYRVTDALADIQSLSRSEDIFELSPSGRSTRTAHTATDQSPSETDDKTPVEERERDHP